VTQLKNNSAVTTPARRSLLRLDRAALCGDRLPTRLGDVQSHDLHALAACRCLVRPETSIARSKQCAISSASALAIAARPASVIRIRVDRERAGLCRLAPLGDKLNLTTSI
jgi:hypothetical protein